MSAEADLATGIALVPPRAEFLYEAIADIGPTIPLGASPLGERRIVNILGGRFAGPGLKGVVLAGGADRQLVRADGVTELDALYEMQTDDGAVLTVNNRVLVDSNAPSAPRYSKMSIQAPDGPYAWLNRLVIIGSLASLRPQREGVLIRAFKLV
jgi:Protein of unknown function (DUF3237)